MFSDFVFYIVFDIRLFAFKHPKNLKKVLRRLIVKNKSKFVQFDMKKIQSMSILDADLNLKQNYQP